MIALPVRSRALPLVVGALAAGLTLAIPLAIPLARGASSFAGRTSPGVVWFVLALTLALLTGIAKTTTV